MQNHIVPQKVFQMVIRLVDNHPILVLPKYDSRRPPPPKPQIKPHWDTLSAPSSTSLQSNKRHPPIPSIRQKGKSQLNASQEHVVQTQLTASLPETRHSPSKTQQIKQLKNTLVESLERITQNKEKPKGDDKQQHRLPSLKWIEAQSIDSKDDTYDFDDNVSEVMELTEQEKEFFAFFIQQKPMDDNFENTLEVSAIELIPAVMEPVHAHDLPHNKFDRTRNFFKQKPQEVRQQKFGCASQTQTEATTMRSKVFRNESPQKKMLHDYF